MDRALARTFASLSDALGITCQIAVQECLALATDQQERCNIELIHVIARLDASEIQSELKTKIRIEAMQTYDLVRSGAGAMTQNDTEAKAFGRPTRINFRLHLNGEDKETLKVEMYRHALGECERIAQVFRSPCQVEHISFQESSRSGLTAQINLVIPHGVGFGAGLLKDRFN